MEGRRLSKDGSPLTQYRAADKDEELLQRGFRRTLKRKAPDSKFCWAEDLSAALCDIVCDKTISPRLRLQAIRTAIEINGYRPSHAASSNADEPGAMSATYDPLRPTREEEALSDAELDAQIAELQNSLGSAPASDA